VVVVVVPEVVVEARGIVELSDPVATVVDVIGKPESKDSAALGVQAETRSSATRRARGVAWVRLAVSTMSLSLMKRRRNGRWSVLIP
jgi:hypothetical protein